MRKSILFAAACGLFFGTAVSRADDKINFEKQIYPMIKASCNDCHRPVHENPERPGRKVKPKGGHVFTNKADLMAGETEDGKKFIVPGKPLESRMLIVTQLALEDDDHYPPEGKAPQWTDAEKALFAKWIEQGADFGAWTEDPDPLTVPEWDGKERAPGSVLTAP